MTQAPQLPHARSYLGNGDPLELVDSPFGRMEREKAKAMATGEFSALVELGKKIRNDSAAIVARQNARDDELNARADNLTARELKVAADTAMITDLMGRVGKAIDWIEAQKKARADAEREPLLPPGDESKEPEPALELEDDTKEPSNTAPEPPASPIAPPSLDLSLMDELQPRMPVAAGLDKADGD